MVIYIEPIFVDGVWIKVDGDQGRVSVETVLSRGVDEEEGSMLLSRFIYCLN
jgi:hypothetical protein